jgi:hypothetical protein
LNCSLWSAFQKHSPCYWSFYCFHSCWIQDGTLWYRFHILGCPTTKQLNSVSACVMQTFWWIFLRCYHGHQFARYIVLYSSTSWCTLGFFPGELLSHPVLPFCGVAALSDSYPALLTLVPFHGT